MTRHTVVGTRRTCPRFELARQMLVRLSEYCVVKKSAALLGGVRLIIALSVWLMLWDNACKPRYIP